MAYITLLLALGMALSACTSNAPMSMAPPVPTPVGMAAYLGSHGAKAFGGDDLPRAGAVILQYTGHTDYTPGDPPTYVCVGKDDGIASWRTMESRINNLKTQGIDTEFHLYPNLGHGFGLGIGTSAEGWLDDAVAFWEKQMKE